MQDIKINTVLLMDPSEQNDFSLQTFEQYNFFSVCDILVNNSINKKIIQDP